MSKKIISIFFSFVIIIFIVVPTAVIVLENNIDVSVTFDIGEEENKESESFKDFELKFLSVEKNLFILAKNERKNFFKNQVKKYSQLHIESISPPPELI
ncbi:hypothetical protein [Lutibacter sp. B1]|uniref:hypothetical protein n=1 Tax=Lutibacter sp. B1 TaxID=2725996 RepID=UPI0014563696|nr:hypothetical protein [Lutibacter sp. B1]NLP59268.1 hypothetical protein [Lutibacter sp. B1]